MFNIKRTKKLEAEIKNLTTRLEYLEKYCCPVVVEKEDYQGKIPRHYYSWEEWQEPVETKRILQVLMDHCGIHPKYHKGKDATITIEKDQTKNKGD